MSQVNSETNGPVHVAYLGPEASFSHQAALAVFPSSCATLHPLHSFTTIFDALQASSSSDSNPTSQAPNGTEIEYTYALLPVENSTNGSVVQVLDLLSQCSDKTYSDLEVCGEYYLSVHHCLFTYHNPDSTSSTQKPSNSSSTMKDEYSQMKTIYTHPQVWGQVSRFLSTRFPPSVTGAERIDVSSTSTAARLVSQDSTGNSAAICSSLAGKLHKLRLLAENIEDEPGTNTTRFFVMRNRTRRQNNTKKDDVGKTDQQRNWKSLITFTIPHSQPGSLADALAVFKSQGFNLTSIDSRPSRRRNWHYVFLVECEKVRSGVINDEDNTQKEYVGELISELKEHTEVVRYMGSWIDQLQDTKQNGDDVK